MLLDKPAFWGYTKADPNQTKGDIEMTLQPIAANMNEVQLNGSLTVLFSYKTPVACVWTNGQGSRALFKTSKKWSTTTSRHINKWANMFALSEPIKDQPQEYFDTLIAGVK